MKTEQSNKGFLAGLVAGATIGVATLASFVFPSRDTDKKEPNNEKPAVTKTVEDQKSSVIVISDLPPINNKIADTTSIDYFKSEPIANIDRNRLSAPNLVANENSPAIFNPTNYIGMTEREPISTERGNIARNQQDFPRLGFSYFSTLDNQRNFDATFQLNNLNFPASVTLSSNLDSSVTALTFKSELNNGDLEIKAIFDRGNDNAIITGNYSGKILDFEFGKLYKSNGQAVDSSAYLRAVLEHPNDPSFKASVNYEDYLGQEHWNGSIQKTKDFGNNTLIFRAGFTGQDILNKNSNTQGVFQIEILR